MHRAIPVLLAVLVLAVGVTVAVTPTASAGMTCRWSSFECHGDACAAGFSPVPGGWIVGCAAFDY